METVQRTFLFFVFSYFFREFRVMPAVHHREPLGRRQDLPERSRKSNDLLASLSTWSQTFGLLG